MTAMPLALDQTLSSAGLPAAARKKADLLGALIKDVLAARHGATALAYEDAARQMRAAGYKMSGDGIRALAARYRTEGYSALIDKRLLPHEDNALPAAFKKHVKARFQLHARSEGQEHEELIKEWRAGRPIPGYPIHPKAHAFTGLPHGWSLKNLQRATRSTAFEKTAMREGLGKARAKHAPKHFTTRRDLWHLSHIMADDVENDEMVYVGTKSQSCRVVQLGMLDVFSGNYFTYGTRPMLKRWDAKKNKFITEGLKEANMRFLLAMQLYQYGYSPLGTEYPVELGTATIREDVARILHDRTGGLVRVNLAGWTGKKQIIEGMHCGRGGGNPRHKAPLESLHNLLHNKLAALPGQTGPSVDRRPEQLHGLLNAQDELMAIAKVLTPWQVEQLKFPLLEYSSQYLPVLAAVIDAMNKRRHHQLEGWSELGFLTDQYRFHRGSEEWLTKQQFLELPDSTRAMLSAEVKRDNALHRPSRLSPYEVFSMQRGGAVRASVSMIAEILYLDLAQERKCRNGYFEFHDQEISPEILRYHSRVTTFDGREEELAPDTYETVVNPLHPELLWVYSGKRGKGAFLGTARRAEKSSRVDREQAERTLTYEAKRHADLARPVKELHTDLTRKEAQRLKTNSDVIEAGHGTEAEKRFAEHEETIVLPAGKAPAAPVEDDADEPDPLDPRNLL